jgi:hydroxypyruvate isomerase
MNRRSFSKSLAGAALGVSLEPFAALAKPEPALNLSVMLWTVFTKLPFEERLEKVAQAGYRNVELVGEYQKWSEAEFVRAIAKQKELGITFDVTAGLRHGVGNPADRDNLVNDVRRELPIMERLQIPAVIIMSGNVVPGTPRAVQHQSCIDGLKAAAKLIDGKQINGQPVRLLLENIDPEENSKYYLTSVAEGFEIIRAVDHPQVQFLYDFYHEQIAEGNLIEKLEKNIEYTGLVHIADVPGRHAPGTGEIDYDNIYRKLVQLKYKRMVAMEFIPLGDGVTELRTAREQALRAAGAV